VTIARRPSPNYLSGRLKIGDPKKLIAEISKAEVLIRLKMPSIEHQNLDQKSARSIDWLKAELRFLEAELVRKRSLINAPTSKKY